MRVGLREQFPPTTTTTTSNFSLLFFYYYSLSGGSASLRRRRRRRRWNAETRGGKKRNEPFLPLSLSFDVHRQAKCRPERERRDSREKGVFVLSIDVLSLSLSLAFAVARIYN